MKILGTVLGLVISASAAFASAPASAEPAAFASAPACGQPAAFASAAAPAQPAAADTAALRAAVQTYLDTLRAAGRFPGVSVGIALPDGTTLGVVSGVADRGVGVPLTPEARLLAGSVGKTFFAALALQLAQDGRLELDAPIAGFLGDEPWFDRLPNARATTVRMLLNHTSGLVRYEFDPAVTELLTAEPDKVWTAEERLSYVFDTDAPFAAGKSWVYSDTNYIVLGMILERITGTAAYAEIASRFIEPLALRNTVPSDRRVIPGLVQGHAGPANPFGGRDAMLEDGRLIFNPQMEWAGGGYASTPVDLAVWARALYGGRFHDADVVAAMVEAVAPTSPNASFGYGLGVIVRQTSLGTALGHGGFFPGYLSDMRYYPDHDLGIAVQFNTSVPDEIDRNIAAVAHDLAELVVRR